jgi:lipopolysaccharide/colanic/teichoic acid biosynthesis glycosyltransferase
MALVLIVVTLPVLAFTVVASIVLLRSNPFFAHERIGRNGRPFRFIKVRTLPVETAAYAAKYALDPHAIPPLCRKLRRLHLDELPQLFLVLRGTMAIVGPRPEMPGLHAQLPASFAEARTSVRPGCTGLWQIGDACQGLIGEAPAYDLHYVGNANLRLDAWILWRTVLKVTGHGTVSLDDIPAWAAPSVPEPALVAQPAE